MNEINIETFENEKKANFKMYIDKKLELDVKGLKYNNTKDLMGQIGGLYERYVPIDKSIDIISKGNAKYAGYYETAQAIKITQTNKKFTTKELSRIILDESESNFKGVHANVSAAFSCFKRANWYPDWLKVVGMRGRSREYIKNKDVSAKEIEDDLRKATKKAWP